MDRPRGAEWEQGSLSCSSCGKQWALHRELEMEVHKLHFGVDLLTEEETTAVAGFEMPVVLLAKPALEPKPALDKPKPLGLQLPT